MRQVNLHEAKTQLSRLVAAVEKGEPFIIARAGKPVAKVVPFESASPAAISRIGMLDGQMPELVALFDSWTVNEQEELQALFYGPSPAPADA